MTTSTVTTEKATYVEVLHAVAAILGTQPEVEPPSIDFTGALTWLTVDSPDEIAAIMRAFPASPWAKNDPTANDFAAEYATFTGMFMGRPARIIANRDEVCTRRVVGTREVTKTVPVITEEVTVTEDIVEWECHSILAQVSA